MIDVKTDAAGRLRALAAEYYRRSDNVPLSRNGSTTTRVGDLREVADRITKFANEVEETTCGT